MANLKCIVVTPEQTALQQDAQFVVVPLYDGELGIAAGHSPLIGRLGFGELRLRTADGTSQHYYVDGGFVQVIHNAVNILTGRLVPVDQLDAKSAQEQIDAAMARPTATEELEQLRWQSLEQARAQLRLALKYA